jgi:hypothetical protein
MDDHESHLGFRGFKELMVRAWQNSERLLSPQFGMNLPLSGVAGSEYSEPLRRQIRSHHE